MLYNRFKKRHLEQTAWSLTFDEILEELQMHDLTNKTKQWLLEVSYFQKSLPKNH